MNFIDKKQKLDYLLELIKKERTGKADSLAASIYVSVPTLNRYISNLRELGYRIEYSRTQQTYFLLEDNH
ncbi:MAG: HTH domain-containing protein [Bacteroidales bacterium]